MPTEKDDAYFFCNSSYGATHMVFNHSEEVQRRRGALSVALQTLLCKLAQMPRGHKLTFADEALSRHLNHAGQFNAMIGLECARFP